MTIPRIPTATYRLQFREGMTFERARDLAPYLARTGVSHLYASPLFRAASGSTHGYDVTDHTELDPTLGGRDGFNAMSDALAANDLGVVLDIVPNHMAATPENPWWRDVLRHGQASRYAGHFDIDWSRPKLLLTQLGAPYGEVLDAGELSLGREADGLVLRYYDNAFPLDPATWSIAAPGFDVADDFANWIADEGNAARLDAALEAADRDRVHAVHEAQPWRLAHWRAARDMLGHRRFFEITDLVGVRVEDETVFDDVHAATFDLIREGRVHGLRIDHVDGLADPGGYLAMLRERVPKLADGGDVPVWVEKILGHGEMPPPQWPIEGTTGYVAGRAIAGVLTDRAGEGALTGAYAAFTGRRQDYDRMLRAAKREIITVNLAAELDLLTTLARMAGERDLVARDFGPDSLRIALVALMTAMPVYRTYLGSGEPSDADARVLERVRAEAKADPTIEDTGPLDYLMRLLTAPEGDAARTFQRRLQQTTGAVMAKSLEDTLFYRTHRLISLNEVGAEPDQFGLSHEDWHAEMAARVEAMPHGLIATATHDTKRGEDARMRITAISSKPEDWGALATRHDRQLVMEHSDAPNPNTRWLFYQALLGAYEEGQPRDVLAERMTEYMIKAAREAKLRTSWVAVDEGHEGRVRGFVGHALSEGGFLDAFLADAAPYMERGRMLSLQQLALKCTMPGVPDFYQGTGLGDFSLVDPDNRRPVDWDHRRVVVDAVAEGETPPDGMGVKAALTMALLGLRARERALFENGSYRPLAARYDAETVARPLAFARERDGRAVVTVIDHRMDGDAVLIEWPYADPEPLDWAGEATEWERRVDELAVTTVRPAHILVAG